MSIQDRNAGNAGDQLKHALLLEMIARLPEGAHWAYSETHSGAGSYATPNAPLLFRGAWGVPERDAAGPGGAYARALCNWWRKRTPIADLAPAHADTAILARMPYPGSAVLAVSSDGVRGPISLAEADPAVRARLEQALDLALGVLPALDASRGAARARKPMILAGSFEEHLARLLAPDPLILLADPYYYQSEAPDSTGGRLSAQHLRAIVAGLRDRDAALIIFTSHMPAELLTLETADALCEGTWEALYEDLARHAPPQLRAFRIAGAPHAVVIAGWGCAAALVRSLPGQEAWRRSWLASPPIALEVLEVAGAGERS